MADGANSQPPRGLPLPSRGLPPAMCTPWGETAQHSHMTVVGCTASRLTLQPIMAPECMDPAANVLT
jgi:hypothetical protein